MGVRGSSAAVVGAGGPVQGHAGVQSAGYFICGLEWLGRASAAGHPSRKSMAARRAPGLWLLVNFSVHFFLFLSQLPADASMMSSRAIIVFDSSQSILQENNEDGITGRVKGHSCRYIADR
jgi:hypothetical protein